METLNIFLNSHDLDDRWRRQNSRSKEFSWNSRKAGNNARSRIDRFHVNSRIYLNKQEHEHCVFTDHTFVKAEFRFKTKSSREQTFIAQKQIGKVFQYKK